MMLLIPNINNKNLDFVVCLTATLDKFVKSYCYQMSNMQLNQFIQVIYGCFDLLQNLKVTEFQFQSQYDENLFDFEYDFQKSIDGINDTK